MLNYYYQECGGSHYWRKLKLHLKQWIDMCVYRQIQVWLQVFINLHPLSIGAPSLRTALRFNVNGQRELGMEVVRFQPCALIQIN